MKATMITMALVCAASMYAQNPLSTELKQGYNMVKGQVTGVAATMPDADYSFKPTPQTRPFGEVVNHIADVQGALCATAKGDGKKFTAGATDKASATAYLKSVFDYCDAVYDSITDQNASQMVKMFGRDRTKYGTLDFALQHDMDEYGVLTVYLRLKGLVPPASAGRGMGGKKE